MADKRVLHPVPSGLGQAGTRLWKSVTDWMALRPDELAVLREACAVADAIAALEQTLGASDVMISGSQGQDVLHPAISELRLQRATLATLLGKIDVPEAEDEEGERPRSWDGLTSTQRARRASRARWNQRGAA